jgi:hypothetical protein
MQTQEQPQHALTCHRCGKPMNFFAEEVVEDKRVAVFRCADCDTLEALERRTAA